MLIRRCVSREMSFENFQFLYSISFNAGRVLGASFFITAVLQIRSPKLTRDVDTSTQRFTNVMDVVQTPVVSQRDGSTDGSQHMFYGEIWRIIKKKKKKKKEINCYLF